MPLVRNCAVVEDRFVRVLDDAAIADDLPVIVPAARLLADVGDLVHRSGATGVLWPNDRDVSDLAPNLDRLALVALDFPNFRDGRAYSQARILRERYNYRGELRATGQVLRDQFMLLHRAGFDSFEVSKPADASAFVETIARYSVVYQPAGAGVPAALRRQVASSKAGTRAHLREHDA
jgi:uncharacterized protein (DUF934 family)